MMERFLPNGIASLRWEWAPVHALAQPHPSASPSLRLLGALDHLLDDARRLTSAEAAWLAVLAPVIVTPRRDEFLVLAGHRTLAVCRVAAPCGEIPVLIADNWSDEDKERLIWLSLTLGPLALSLGQSTAVAACLKVIMDTHLAGANGSRLAEILNGVSLEGVRSRHGLAKATRSRRRRLPPNRRDDD